MAPQPNFSCLTANKLGIKDRRKAENTKLETLIAGIETEVESEINAGGTFVLICINPASILLKYGLIHLYHNPAKSWKTTSKNPWTRNSDERMPNHD